MLTRVPVVDLGALPAPKPSSWADADVEPGPWNVADVGAFFENTQPSANDGREHLRVLAFSCRGTPLALATLSIGTPTQCAVSIRDVLRFVINTPAAVAFAITHNHPSGDAGPSDADRAVTRTLRAAAAQMDLALVCHVVTAQGEWALADDETEADAPGPWQALPPGQTTAPAPAPPRQANPDVGAPAPKGPRPTQAPQSIPAETRKRFGIK